LTTGEPRFAAQGGEARGESEQFCVSAVSFQRWAFSYQPTMRERAANWRRKMLPSREGTSTDRLT